jgi:hypothetical protein
MLLYMPLLIIKQLQSPHNSRRANHREIILKYRKHEALKNCVG